MSTAPEYPSHPPGHHPTAAPESGGSSMERPAQRRRTDSGPNIEYYTPSYTTSAPPPHIQSPIVSFPQHEPITTVWIA
ncbi:hypothetical protein SBRCBS47491_006768 [Sporothrix bragantina]|uniref:Uncharacterized protein n=1 Tax=Sporothrix bragantina TaxID=671064 RepID=A0ABP0C7R6_9PEZI